MGNQGLGAESHLIKPGLRSVGFGGGQFRDGETENIRSNVSLSTKKEKERKKEILVCCLDPVLSKDGPG